jgi:Tol biopolymer transport system component
LAFQSTIKEDFMHTKLAVFVILTLLISAAAFSTVQNVVDPIPECAVVGLSSKGPAGEIKCREDALKKTATSSPRHAAMQYSLAQFYDNLGESKAKEYYEQLVTEHCKDASNRSPLCDPAQQRIKKLMELGGGPLRVDTAFTADPYSFAVSPDGKKVVYLATVRGTNALWLHDIASARPDAPIHGTEGGRYSRVWTTDDGSSPSGPNPFWSPDGKSIGYFEDGKLKRIDVNGSNAKTLAAAPENYGGTWGTDGVIVFVPKTGLAVYSISENGGGTPVQIAGLNPRTIKRSPQFLPDGRHFLIRDDRGPLSVGSLDGTTAKYLGISVQMARFVQPDQLVFVNNGALYAQRLDPQTLELTGEQLRIEERVAAIATTPVGTVAYRRNTGATRQFVWMDRHGQRVGGLGQHRQTTSGTPRFSPDGKSVLLAGLPTGRLPAGWTASMTDVSTGAQSFTSLPTGMPAYSSNIVWSPDGKSIATAMAPGPIGVAIYRLPAHGPAPKTPDRLYSAGGNKAPLDWFGDYILFAQENDTTGMNVLALRTTDRVAVPVAEGADDGRFSSDGKWVAYQARAQAGKDDIYIQPFPGDSSTRRLVSPAGGRSPQWSRDGRELYFLSLDNHLMVAPVAHLANGEIRIDPAKPLFATTIPEGSTYSPEPNGQRFLFHMPEDALPIYVLSTWMRSTGTNPVPIAAAPAANGRGATNPTTADGERGNVAPTLRQIAIFDRQGKPIATTGDSVSASSILAISPDGFRVAVLEGRVLSVIDIATNKIYRLATDAVNAPVWSPDSLHVAYCSNRASAAGMYVRQWNGEGPEEKLRTGAIGGTWNWSLDARFIGVTVQNNFAALSTSGDGKLVTIGPAAGKTSLRISPDGQFVAYLSNEFGANQVVVRSFDPSSPDPAGSFRQSRISTAGSVGVIRWNKDANEIYYLALDGNFMVATLTTGPQIKAGEPKPLFHVPPGFPITDTPGRIADISADGQRFLFLVPVEAAEASR